MYFSEVATTPSYSDAHIPIASPPILLAIPPYIPMLLTDLPLDILRLIPEHFESLDDLHALILTSRVLYFANSAPSLAYRAKLLGLFN
ncbi:hypothetical protein A0H81_00409 [Grifola frondosa]|uniref:F-box domain-containing protein n=1 Tax=Grifola frondosa TaxID=5627 RepID=A0A1C7MU79_GRIFR|nr:hypothetical protein A0H81_00409 [Grifola frondosa]